MSPTVFAIQDGAIVGVLTADGATTGTAASEPPPKKRSFWQRLFGKR